MKKIAVLGAGPMGLVCALDLLRAGHAVDIFERGDRIGGMSASFDFDGLLIERYYHFICKTDVALFDLLDELDLSDRLRWTDTRMGFYCDGRLYRWGTPAALFGFDRLGWIDKFRYAAHVMHTKGIGDWSELDRVGAIPWLRRWLGPRGYDVLWRRVLELKFFEYSDHLSAAWLGTRIKRVALSRRNLLRESLGYLKGGSACVLSALEQRITQLGGRIHVSAGVDRVTSSDGRVCGVVVEDRELPFDRVVSSAPIQYVPDLVPDLPESFVARIRAVENIPVVCVILKLKHALTDNFWMNISDPDIDIPGLIEYSNLNPGEGPAIVYAPFYMPSTHPKYARDEAHFIDEVVEYLPRINPAFESSWLLAAHCHRYRFAQTVCPPGFAAALPPMRTPLRGFYMADTAYYYPEDRSISESISTGRALARAALAEDMP